MRPLYVHLFIYLSFVATPAHGLAKLCPNQPPAQLWARIILSPICLRLYRPPEPPDSWARRAVSATKRAVKRTAKHAFSRYVTFFDRTAMWTYQLLSAFAQRLATATFFTCFVLALVAEGARRRWNLPNVVASIERFIDEHVRLQRYAIHQILFISWLLTGSWADIYTWLRDLFFRHVSEVSWALLLARGCMRLVDSVVDAAARRVLLARMCGPTAKRCLSFATWQLGCVCLILAAGRELALQLLGRDPEYDTSSVIELLLEIVAAPLARCCGTTLALSLVAEFWAVMVVVLVWFEELRLLQAMGRYNAAMVIKAKCLARKAEIRRGEIQRKQSWSLSRAADDTRAISSGTLIGSSLQPANLSPPSAALSTTPSAQLSAAPRSAAAASVAVEAEVITNEGSGDVHPGGRLTIESLRAAIAEQRADIAAARDLAAALVTAEQRPVIVVDNMAAARDLVGDLAHALRTVDEDGTSVEQRAAAFVTDLDGCIRQAGSVADQALAQFHGPAVPFCRPLARLLLCALQPRTVVSPPQSTDVSESSGYTVLAVVSVLVFPPCAALSALTLAGTQRILAVVAAGVSDLFAWLGSYCLDALMPCFRALQVALQWRTLLQTRAPLLFVTLPMCVWVGLRCWCNPEEARRMLHTAKEITSGRSHQSRCVMRMVLRQSVPKHEPEAGDTCPICIDSLVEGELSYCRWGCGRPVHTACMDSWRAHRNAVGLTECLVCKAWM